MPLTTYREALREALDKELDLNENVILMGEDLGTYGGSNNVEEGLLDKYGENRVISTPMSKSAVMGAAVGAAMTGLIPIVEISSSDFLTIALDALINQAAKISYLTEGQTSVPLVLRVPTGIDQNGGVNQSQNLESLLMGIPGIKIIAPSTPQQARDLLQEAIEDPNPVVFLEDKNLYDLEDMVTGDKIFSQSKSEVERPGSDVTVVAWGNALKKVKDSAGTLAKEGIYPEIINPITLKPLDMQPIIDSVMKTGSLVIVHDGPRIGGIGSEIATQVIESEAFNYLDKPIIRVTGRDSPVPFNRELKRKVSVSEKDILEAIYSII